MLSMFLTPKAPQATQSVLRLPATTISAAQSTDTPSTKHDASEAAAPADFAGLVFDPQPITSIEGLTRVGFEACLNRELDLAPSLAASIAVLSTDATKTRATLLVSRTASADVVRSVLERLEHRGIAPNETGVQAWWCSVTVLTAVVADDVSAQQTRMVRARMGDSAQSALWQSFMDIVEWAHSQGANDIDFKICHAAHESQVFFKINGRYITMPRWSLPTETLMSMLGIAWQHSKGGAGSKFEPRQEQQCNVDVTLSTQSRLRLRWASMATDKGCTVTFRLQPLGSSRIVQTLEEAGYLSEQVEIFRRVVMGKGGLTTLAGTVGSGKTVTLAILMGLLPPNTKIVSFEDPVEIENDNLHQKTISRDLVGDDDRDFQAGVRALFRSALDMFMLGEVRDVTTGKVVRAVLESGHSCYTTTHAGSALGIISKFASPQVGIPLDVLGDPGMLKLNVYQALLLRNCDCALTPQALADDLKGDALTNHKRMFDDIESLYGLGQGVFRVRNPQGCPKCRRHGLEALTGFSGRTVVAEMIEPDETMCELILAGKKVDLQRYWRGLSDGDLTSSNLVGKSAMEIALLKASKGVIDPYEIEHHFEPFSTLKAKAAAEKMLSARRHASRASIFGSTPSFVSKKSTEGGVA
ncbi:ATPase, T2SS/T4P/T4SS family [Limnohabitans sp. DM1]|uniref:ATPase, T2SS/T4P/T4SS family n=1 Tax=Limnohabitans sp. DM1 TaxID=1597955 RepID=UPI000AFC369E